MTEGKTLMDIQLAFFFFCNLLTQRPAAGVQASDAFTIRGLGTGTCPSSTTPRQMRLITAHFTV